MESIYLLVITFIGTTGSCMTWQKYRQDHLPIRGYNLSLLIPMFIIAIMLAIRCYYNDWFQYYSLFLQYQTGYDPLREPEFLWKGITQLFAATGMSVQSYFVLMFSLQLWLFFRILRKNFIFLLPLATAIYITTDMLNGTNIMRHWTAILIFINAIPYIEKRKIWQYIICIFLASGFHKSIWIFFPLYWVLNWPLTSNIKTQIIIILISLLCGETLILKLIRSVTTFAPQGYYDFYISKGDDLQLNKGHISSGLGMLLIYLCNLSVVIYSNILRNYYKKYHFGIFYKGFFYGIVLFSLLYKAGDSARISAYLYYIHPFMIAFLLHYLWKHRQKEIYFYWFIALWLMSLAPVLINLFQKGNLIFFWNMQEHLDFMNQLNSHKYLN